MIERLLLALLIVAAIVGAGYLVRAGVAYCRRRNLTAVAPSRNGLPRLFAFSSSGCTACRTQHRIIESVAAEWPGRLDVAYVDAVVERELASQFGIMMVPTTVVAAPDGRIVGVNGGLADAEWLRRHVSEAAA